VIELPDSRQFAKCGWIDSLRVKSIIDYERNHHIDPNAFDILLSQKVRDNIMEKA